jgi:hypothetical protein
VRLLDALVLLEDRDRAHPEILARIHR